MFKSDTMGLIALLLGAAAIMGLALLYVAMQEDDGPENDIQIEAPVPGK